MRLAFRLPSIDDHQRYSVRVAESGARAVAVKLTWVPILTYHGSTDVILAYGNDLTVILMVFGTDQAPVSSCTLNVIVWLPKDRLDSWIVKLACVLNRPSIDDDQE